MFSDGFSSGVVVPVIPFVLEHQAFVPEKNIQISTPYLSQLSPLQTPPAAPHALGMSTVPKIGVY